MILQFFISKSSISEIDLWISNIRTVLYNENLNKKYLILKQIGLVFKYIYVAVTGA